MNQVNLLEISAAARVLNTKPCQLRRTLQDQGVFHKAGALKNTPHSQYLERGFFTTVLGTFKQHGLDRFYSKALITPTGLSFIRELMDAVEIRSRPAHEQTERVVCSERHRPPSEQVNWGGRSEVLRMVGSTQA